MAPLKVFFLLCVLFHNGDKLSQCTSTHGDSGLLGCGPRRHITSCLPTGDSDTGYCPVSVLFSLLPMGAQSVSCIFHKRLQCECLWGSRDPPLLSRAANRITIYHKHSRLFIFSHRTLLGSRMVPLITEVDKRVKQRQHSLFTQSYVIQTDEFIVHVTFEPGSAGT